MDDTIDMDDAVTSQSIDRHGHTMSAVLASLRRHHAEQRQGSRSRSGPTRAGPRRGYPRANVLVANSDRKEPRNPVP
jgi:hypothetical protein